MNIVDIEEYIEHSIPVERNITDLLLTDAVKPDLTQLRSNRKKDSRKKTGGSDGRKDNKNPKHSRNKPSSNSDSNRSRREKGNPNRMPKKKHNDQREHSNEKSPQQREAEKLAAMEKLSKQPRKPSRMPLRGRKGHEVPAVG